MMSTRKLLIRAAVLTLVALVAMSGSASALLNCTVDLNAGGLACW